MQNSYNNKNCPSSVMVKVPFKVPGCGSCSGPAPKSSCLLLVRHLTFQRNSQQFVHNFRSYSAVRQTNRQCPPRQIPNAFSCLCALVYMVLWHNAVIAFSLESGAAGNIELRPLLSHWEEGVTRSRSFRIRTFIFFGTRARTPKLCSGSTLVLRPVC